MAAAAAVTYVERTQIGKRPPLSPPLREAAGATLAIDQATRSNLELIRTLAGERRGSLLAAIDRTVTAAGSRLLAQRLAAPLTDPAGIAQRLDAVAAFVGDSAARTDLRGSLKAVPDLARALSRIVIGRGGPRDLAAIRDGIFAAAEFSAKIAALAQVGSNLPRDIAQAVAALRRPDAAVAAELKRALAEELPAYRRDGGFVRAGYEQALDEARALRDESRRVIAALQVRYAETTGIRSLKIRHNNVLGYFVDVTAQNGEKLLSAPLNATFIHRQTTAGQVRFTTTELGELEAKIANAAERALALELEIFDRLAASVAAASADDQGSGGRARRHRRRYGAGEPRDRARLRAPRGRWQPCLRRRGRPPSGRRAGARHPSHPPPQAGEGWVGDRSSPTIAICRRHRRRRTPRRGASGSSPARTWRGNRRSCARTRSSPCWRRWEVSCRRGPPISAWSTACSRASAPPTISPAGARPSWSRWSRRRRSSTRRASARSSSSTRSAAARRPSTGSPSPGRRSSICTRRTAAARCSPRISTR